MQLPAEFDLILEKKSYEKNTVKSFCFSGGKMVITLLTKIVIDYVVIIYINIKKVDIEKTFMRVFCSRKFGFYCYSNNVLHVLICINLWRSFGLAKAAVNILQGFDGKA